jgi:hypothetical protein
MRSILDLSNERADGLSIHGTCALSPRAQEGRFDHDLKILRDLKKKGQSASCFPEGMR